MLRKVRTVAVEIAISTHILVSITSSKRENESQHRFKERYGRLVTKNTSCGSNSASEEDGIVRNHTYSGSFKSALG